MWYYFVSVYFLHKRDEEDKLDDSEFEAFLTKIIAFIWTYAVVNPGVNALRTPVYAEMVNIVNNRLVEFADFKFDAQSVKVSFQNFSFNNGRPITKSMLTWWAFANPNQTLPKLESIYEIEHIFSRNRQKIDNTLVNINNLEALGNKSLLEERINIRASDYRFADKIKYYKGFINSKNQRKEGTIISDLLQLAGYNNDFTEIDIENRNSMIIDSFIEYLSSNNLLK